MLSLSLVLTAYRYISSDYLVTDHRTFCQLAFERNSLVQVANVITSITPLEKTEFEEDEPDSVSRLREVRLHPISMNSY